MTARPCALIGGRGTGKTTVLRGLSYHGQLALSKHTGQAVADWPFFGFYHRVNTNRVAAFHGSELSEDRWTRLFAHYVNLQLCDTVFDFLQWYRINSNVAFDFPREACERVAASLGIGAVSNLRELGERLTFSRIACEAYINNVADPTQSLSLSLQGAPIDELLFQLKSLPAFSHKLFFFLIDEYENLSNYQQQVFNTLIKHSGELYTFKIGVKELGWRKRTTLNETEQLISPADYARISIADKLEGTFKEFATSVCNRRMKKLSVPKEYEIQDIHHVFASLTEDEEAELLGVRDIVAEIRAELVPNLSDEDTTEFDSLTPLRAYLLRFWAEGESRSLIDTFSDFKQDPAEWETRFGNYKHALLYTIRKRKVGISKYYCGWDVFLQLAATNIRYLLELVDQSLLMHLRSGGNFTQNVSPRIQTEAAQNVGKKNLAELEGLSVHGAQLTKLLLGLGRVFEIMAENAVGHAPEVNQFHLADEIIAPNVEELLGSAVMHLALVRFPGNKAIDETDTKEYDYRVHPVYSPFFGFSYRRKRRMSLTGADLTGLVNDPSRTIREILGRSGRLHDAELPQQLLLFEKYYHGSA